MLPFVTNLTLLEAPHGENMETQTVVPEKRPLSFCFRCVSHSALTGHTFLPICCYLLLIYMFTNVTRPNTVTNSHLARPCCVHAFHHSCSSSVWIEICLGKALKSLFDETPVRGWEIEPSLHPLCYLSFFFLLPNPT